MAVQDLMYRFTPINRSKYQERKEFEAGRTQYEYPWDKNNNESNFTLVNERSLIVTATVVNIITP